MNSESIDFIVPGRVLNIRTWYEDSLCHDKRAETRIPTIVLNYAASQGFGGTPSLVEPLRIRLTANGDPNQAASWTTQTQPMTVRNVQTTNGYRWFYAADVAQAAGPAGMPAGGVG